MTGSGSGLSRVERVRERFSSLKEITMEMSLARRYEKMRPRTMDWTSCCQSAMVVRTNKKTLNLGGLYGTVINPRNGTWFFERER